MISNKDINKAVKNLVKEYNPYEIYLFGSYAWGKPDDDSDLDLLIVLEESNEKPYKRSLRAFKVLRDIYVAKDILVYTKEEFNTLANDIVTLCYRVKSEGVKLYDAARSMAN